MRLWIAILTWKSLKCDTISRLHSLVIHLMTLYQKLSRALTRGPLRVSQGVIKVKELHHRYAQFGLQAVQSEILLVCRHNFRFLGVRSKKSYKPLLLKITFVNWTTFVVLKTQIQNRLWQQTLNGALDLFHQFNVNIDKSNWNSPMSKRCTNSSLNTGTMRILFVIKQLFLYVIKQILTLFNLINILRQKGKTTLII